MRLLLASLMYYQCLLTVSVFISFCLHHYDYSFPSYSYEKTLTDNRCRPEACPMGYEKKRGQRTCNSADLRAQIRIHQPRVCLFCLRYPHHGFSDRGPPFEKTSRRLQDIQRQCREAFLELNRIKGRHYSNVQEGRDGYQSRRNLVGYSGLSTFLRRCGSHEGGRVFSFQRSR